MNEITMFLSYRLFIKSKPISRKKSELSRDK